MSRVFAAVVVAAAILPAGLAAGELPKPEPGWGRIEGRVVFQGDLNDPKLKRYRDDLAVSERQSIQDSINGVRPRQLGTVPNHSLLIDDKTRGIRDALVYLRHRPDRIHPALENQHLDPLAVVYENWLYAPRTLIARVGQTVRLVARGEGANFNVQAMAGQSINPLVRPGEQAEFQPTAREQVPIRVICNIRDTAVGYWLIVDHPYAAQTQTDGSFVLDNLPDEEVELVVWHETKGYLARRLKVTVRSGEVTTLAPIVLTPAMLSR
jgi:hypothetical protein